MNIVSLTGSPRENGTTARIARGFTETCRNNGHEVKLYHLNDMNYRGCQGCNRCKVKSPVCVLKDDLTPVLDNIKSCDIAVFASPVYYGDTTGQFKCFIDRTWSFVKPNFTSKLTPGKKALFITAQGFGEEMHRDVTERYTGFLKLYGFEIETIRVTDCSADPDMDVDRFIDKASEIAFSWTGKN